MKRGKSYFTSSFVVTFIGLALGGWVGYIYSGNWEGALAALFLTFMLAVLEVSLSFDNAVVNASVLKNMTPIWRQRFITWGIPVAVFGMRLVFPLLIVAAVAHIGPWEALLLAAQKPEEYKQIMLSSHLALVGYGGSFLLMVAFAYFINNEKQVHWLPWLEKPLAKAGHVESVGLTLGLLTIYLLSLAVESDAEALRFLAAGIFGLLTFVAVEALSMVLKLSGGEKQAAQKSGAAMFIYLQILDASFSFDGVIGAFALTNNLFLIGLGLGIGAMFVRSMTLYLVDKGTLSQFIYLEHGAFYAIGALAAMMLADVFVQVPEVVTGMVGAVLIALSVWSSIRFARGKRKR